MYGLWFFILFFMVFMVLLWFYGFLFNVTCNIVTV